VDQQKIVAPSVVVGVAKDFDLANGQCQTAVTVPNPTPEKLDLADALKALATLADRLRQENKDLPTKGNYEPNS